MPSRNIDDDKKLRGRRIAILATDGFEQSELLRPRDALVEAGAEVEVLSLHVGEIQGHEGREPGEAVRVDRAVSEARPDDYDALVLPGGVYSPDKLRTDRAAISFARAFMEQGRPVAAICHGPQLLINADVVADRKLTAVAAIRQDLANAGAYVIDKDVVVDDNLITSRGPDDLPAFCRAVIDGVARSRGRRAA